MTLTDVVEIVLAVATGGFLYLWLTTREELKTLKAAAPKRDAKGRFQKKKPDIVFEGFE